jgi:hypothetical protein
MALFKLILGTITASLLAALTIAHLLILMMRYQDVALTG